MDGCAVPRVRLALSVCLLGLGLFVVAATRASVASAATTSGNYIVVLKASANAAAAEQRAEAKAAKISQRYRYALKGYAAALSPAALAQVSADPDVAFVSPDSEVSANAQVLNRAVDRIDGDLSSTLSGDGAGQVPVNVAVIDTGIDPTHPDLNVVGGTSCLTGTNADAFNDQGTHGTFVGGQIGMRDNQIGSAGVAPGARLWAIRALKRNGVGTTSQIICGIDAVTASRTDSDPTNDIAVANMSLGGAAPPKSGSSCADTGSDPMYKAVCASIAAGVTYVVAAGNDGVDLDEQVPARYDEVLTATAITDIEGAPGGVGVPESDAIANCLNGFPKHTMSDDTPAFFSNFATLAADRAHTLAAPGVCVGSTFPVASCAELVANPTECYAIGSGTSFASPLVAGTVALCIHAGACAGMTPAQIKAKIVADAAAYNTANPGYGFTGDPLHPGDPGRSYGYLARAGLY